MSTIAGCVVKMPFPGSCEHRICKANIPLSSSQAECAQGCCSGEQGDEAQIFHSGKIIRPLDPGGADDLQPREFSHGVSSLKEKQDPVHKDSGESSTSLEHVVLKFAGSNCPGCTSKVERALESTPSVCNLQMNTILLEAEFDIDIAKSSIREVIESVRGATGRDCERIEDGWQELDVVISNSENLADSNLPAGIKDMTQTSNDTFSVKYDAKVIGARQVLKALRADLDASVTLSHPKSRNEISPDIRRAAYMTLFSSVLTIPVLVLAWAPLPEHKLLYGALSLAFATVIQVIVAGPFYPRALKSLIVTRVIDMDLLVVMSTSIAYVFSVASFICEIEGKNLASGVYFETSTLLITLIIAGRLMADLACHRGMSSVSFKSFQPRLALLAETSELYTDDELEMDVRLLQYGDVFKVKPGSAAVTDGTVISGVSEFDESIATGEASLVEKTAGSLVIAGSVNRGGTVLVQLNRLPGENTINEIARMVEHVAGSKPKMQQTADQIAGWIVPAAGTLAILTLFIWLMVGIFVRNQGTGSAILNAIPYAISLLVVSCPCGIALAVPIVLLVASAAGANHGVIFRTAEAMSMARGATRVIFDSTGTLTETSLLVVREQYYSGPPSLTCALLLALARHSEHPVSSAMAKHLEAMGFEPVPVANCTPVLGKGIEAMWDGEIVRIGSAHWLGVESLPTVQSLFSESLTVSCATQGDRLIAAFGLEATLRQDAKAVVAELFKRGIDVSILSGNEGSAVRKIATELRIPLENVRTRCMPLEKQEHVKSLMHNGNDTVIYCGDGINDETALAQADVGVRIDNGTGFAQNVGDVILTGHSLSGILVLIKLSRDAHRQILFNFAWAFLYNVFAFLLAAGAFVKFRLPPEYAGLGEAVSVLPILLVPLHMRWRDYRACDY